MNPAPEYVSVNDENVDDVFEQVLPRGFGSGRVAVSPPVIIGWRHPQQTEANDEAAQARANRFVKEQGHGPPLHGFRLSG